MNTIDARGLACPEPVILTQKALSSKADEYTILVDNYAAKENVTRFAEHSGYKVSVTESSGEFTLTLSANI